MKPFAPRQGVVALLAPLFAAASHSLQAAEAVPNAGTILQQVQPASPVSPSPGGPGLTIERQAGASPSSNVPFDVRTIRIVGNTLFDTTVLHALVADGEGRPLTLQQLDGLARRITDHYRRHGYPLARAVIPAQALRDGVVEMRVVEARYGSIELNNGSATNEALLKDVLSPLRGGEVISQSELDRALLMLSDIPGVVPRATLKPGASAGASDLVVDVAAASSVTGSATLDSYGNRYTGRIRLGAGVNVLGPLRYGDVLSINGLTAGGGLNYGRLAYEALLNGRGTRVGASYAELRYELGRSLAPLGANGSARMENLWVRQPLLRGRNANVRAELQYEGMQLRDHVDVSATRTDRHMRNWVASLSGDVRDQFLAGAVNIWSIAWTSGRLDFDDAAAQLADAATAATEGRFSRWNASFARLQQLDAVNSVYLSFSGQWVDGNLDAAKKMAAGGPHSVRAYDTGAVSGDEGYVASIEWRRQLGRPAGKWQAVAFVDHARVTINKTPWASADNKATLTGAGAGLNWLGPAGLNVRVFLAAPTGARPAQAADTASARVWAELAKSF